MRAAIERQDQVPWARRESEEAFGNSLTAFEQLRAGPSGRRRRTMPRRGPCGGRLTNGPASPRPPLPSGVRHDAAPQCDCPFYPAALSRLSIVTTTGSPSEKSARFSTRAVSE